MKLFVSLLLLSFAAGDAIGSEVDLPFTPPSEFSTTPTGIGVEGSELGKISSTKREFTITYCVGGQYARRVKRPVKEDNSIDAMFYYNEAAIDGIDAQIVGYRIKSAETPFRVMMWIPALGAHFSVYVSNRDQFDLAVSDLRQFKLQRKKREQGEAP